MILAGNKTILHIYNILKNVTNYAMCVHAPFSKHFIIHKGILMTLLSNIVL